MGKKQRLEDEQQDERGAAPLMSGDPASAPDRDAVARRAYELYQERGGREGGQMDDWLNAERELSSGERNNR